MDVSAMAERLSSAASAPAPSVPAEPAVTATPDATPVAAETPVAAPVATPAAAEPEIQFDDDPPEINFDDDEPAQPPVVGVAAPAAPAVPEGDDSKAVADLSALLRANGLPKQVEDALMRTNRGRNLLGLYKSERVLKEPPEFDPATGENRGGLGFMPTPDQIKQFHQGHSDWTAMLQEFTVNPRSFVTNWFGTDAHGNFRDGVDQVLANVPQVLDQVFTHAQQSGNEALKDKAIGLYRSVFAPMQMSYLDGLYARAAAIADPAQREQVINAARTIESDMFGKFRDDAKIAAASQPDDPLAQRIRDVEEKENHLKSWETKRLNDAQMAVHKEVISANDQNRIRFCEKALASAKAGMSDYAWKAAVNRYADDVKNAIAKDHIGFRDFNFKLTAARSTRGADARAVAIKAYEQLAQRAIRASYRTVLQELVPDIMRQNGALHATAAAAAAQTAPAVNGGQAPPQSIMPTTTVTRKPGEDATEYFQRRLQARMALPN